MIEETDGLYLIVLVHQRHRLAHQRHRLLDQIVQQVVDVDDFLRLGLLGLLSGWRSDPAPRFHHQQFGDIVVDGKDGRDLSLAVADIDRGRLEDLSVRRFGQVAEMILGFRIIALELFNDHMGRSVPPPSDR